MASAVERLLADLVAIPSVNPRLVPGASGEAAIAAAIAEWLRDAGLDVILEEAAPGRPNVIGVLEGRASGGSLLLCGHTDTVGTDGMDDPFTPVVRDGRLYGRGAQDMKAGLAAMIDAAGRVAAGGLERGRLIVACVADEEYGSIGADRLVGRWRADAAVVTEPTDLAIGIGHKGFSAAEIVVHGKAAHGSRPSEGRDAILHMGRVLARLEAYGRVLQAAPPHPLVGHGSLHASVIAGGGELSTYPARCMLQFERRTVPGEDLGVAAQEAGLIAADLAHEDPEFRADVSLLLARPPYALDEGHSLVSTLRDVCRRRGCDAPVRAMSFWTDAAILGAAGIPSVLYGPGGDGLHSPIEYVRLAEVETCRDALVALTRVWCEGQ